MEALAFWKAVTMDQVNLLERLTTLLDENNIHYCIIGGLAVNAYVEPLISLDLDLVVALDQFKRVENLLISEFNVKPFAHSLNVSVPGSDLRVQIQTDERYGEFVQRAEKRTILGLQLPVASLEDVLQGKIWAAQDAERRSSKRQKDFADIARIIETYPQLRDRVPEEILMRLV